MRTRLPNSNCLFSHTYYTDWYFLFIWPTKDWCFLDRYRKNGVTNNGDEGKRSPQAQATPIIEVVIFLQIRNAGRSEAGLRMVAGAVECWTSSSRWHSRSHWTSSSSKNWWISKIPIGFPFTCFLRSPIFRLQVFCTLPTMFPYFLMNPRKETFPSLLIQLPMIKGEK